MKICKSEILKGVKMKKSLEPVRKRGKIGQTALFAYLQKNRKSSSYADTVNLITQYVEMGILVPVKAQGFTPNKAKLFKYYFYNEIISTDLIEKINSFNQLDISWYLEPKQGKKNDFLEPDNWHQEFFKDYHLLKKLDTFLIKHASKMERAVSINERSLEIFGEEKVFEKKNGTSILKRCNIDRAQLNMYETYEFTNFIPLTEQGNNFVMIENEDPMFDLVKAYHEQKKTKFMNLLINSLIYQGGHSLVASLNNPMAKYYLPAQFKAGNKLYIGDLDGAGINIFLSVRDHTPYHDVKPWVAVYEKMLDKAFSENSVSRLDKNKKRNKVKATELMDFLQYFSPKYQKMIKRLFANNCYIPQEILNYSDY